jgi:hypothetical protein
MIRKAFWPTPAESGDQPRTRLAIRYLPIASPKLDPKNPREHTRTGRWQASTGGQALHVEAGRDFNDLVGEREAAHD